MEKSSQGKINPIKTQIHELDENGHIDAKLDKIQENFMMEIFRQNMPYLLFGLGQIILVLAFIFPNENKMHFLESSIARGSAACVISYFIMLRNKQSMSGKVMNDSKIFKTLFVRNCLIIIHSNVYALSQLYLSQPVVQTINCTGPIFTFLTDYLQNRVEINKIQGYGIVFVVLGSVMIANQRTITNMVMGIFCERSTEGSIQESNDQEGMKLMVVIGLFFAVALWGVAQTMVKRFSFLQSSVINMHFAALYMISNGIGYPLLVHGPLEVSRILKTLLYCGVPNTIAALCMIKAAKMTKQTGVLTLMTFVSVLVGEILSLFRYDQQLQVISLLGMINIIGGLGTVILQENKRKQ